MRSGQLERSKLAAEKQRHSHMDKRLQRAEAALQKLLGPEEIQMLAVQPPSAAEPPTSSNHAATPRSPTRGSASKPTPTGGGRSPRAAAGASPRASTAAAPPSAAAASADGTAAPQPTRRQQLAVLATAEASLLDAMESAMMEVGPAPGPGA